MLDSFFTNSLFIFTNSLFAFINSLFIFINSAFIFLNSLFNFMNDMLQQREWYNIFAERRDVIILRFYNLTFSGG